MAAESGGSVIQIGRRAELSRTFDAGAIRQFADLTGDRNPLHLDAAFAARTRFGRPIAHGMLCASLVSAVLGTRLPGPGAIYMSQTLKFAKPVYPGDTVTAAVEVTGWRPDRQIVVLRTTCTNQHGALVLDGEAVLLVEGAG